MFKKKKKPIQAVAHKLITSANPRSIVSEQYRTLRTNINFSMPDKDLKTLLITSANSGEGKSTTAANIAIVFAQEGKRVLLVDADMRRPTMHYTFHKTNSTGFSNILTRKWGLGDVVEKRKSKGWILSHADRFHRILPNYSVRRRWMPCLNNSLHCMTLSSLMHRPFFR